VELDEKESNIIANQPLITAHIHALLLSSSIYYKFDIGRLVVIISL